MSDNEKREYYKNEIVHSLAEVFLRGGALLHSAPSLLLKLIREDLWIERDVNGQTVKYDKTEFKQFVEAHYPQGLSTDIETIEALCKDEPEIMDFLAGVKRGKRGGQEGKTKSSKRVDTSGWDEPSHSTVTRGRQQEAINRLRDDAPEWHEKVKSGEISVNDAMIEAGFIRKRINISLVNAESAYKTLTKNMPSDVLEELIALLKLDGKLNHG